MKYHIEPSQTYSIASITESKSAIAKAIITVDIQSKTTLKSQAVDTILADAFLSGAGTYTRDSFLEAVNLLGASIDIDISEGRITFTLRSTAQTFQALLKLFAVMIESPTFSPAELKRMKSTSINQLHQAKEDSKAIAAEKLQNIFYGQSDRKFTHSIDETIEAVAKLSKKDLVKAHQAVLNHKWYITAGGDKTTISKITTTISKLKQNTNFTENNAVHQPLPPKPALSLEHIASRQNIDLSIGLPLPITNEHPDYLPLMFGIAVLGKWGGFTGRLMSTVREKEGLTYGIYARLEGFIRDEQGYMRIMTFFAPDKVMQGLTSTFREVSKLYAKGITPDEFEKFKTILNTQQTMLQDSLGRLLADLHSYHFQNYTIDEMRVRKAELESITLTDVNRTIRTYLDPSLMSVSAAGPVHKLEAELKKWHQSV